jgi:sec-independent protein translocase protein TatA
VIGGLESPWHLLLLALVALLVFGPSRLPEVGKGVGRGLREFKQAIAGEDDDVRDAERERTRERSELED